MKHEQQVVIKRWVPILEEYERTRAKVKPRAFKSVKLLVQPTIYRLRNCSGIIRDGLSQREIRYPYYRRKEGRSQDQGERRRRLNEISLRLIDSLVQIDMNWF